MAKVTIAGNAVVITSSMKYEDLETIQKYRPDALTLYGGEDGKEPEFTVAVGRCPEIGKYGIVFNGTTRNDDKLACLTICECNNIEDMKEHVADSYGAALTKLNELEGKLAGVVEEIAAAKQAVIDAIEVVE